MLDIFPEVVVTFQRLPEGVLGRLTLRKVLVDVCFDDDDGSFPDPSDGIAFWIFAISESMSIPWEFKNSFAIL